MLSLLLTRFLPETEEGGSLEFDVAAAYSSMSLLLLVEMPAKLRKKEKGGRGWQLLVVVSWKTGGRKNGDGSVIYRGFTIFLMFFP